MKFSTEILSLNPWNRFVSFLVMNAGVNLGKKLVAEDESLQPVYLVNQMLVVLGVCIGNEGARSDMTFREHLIFCHKRGSRQET